MGDTVTAAGSGELQPTLLIPAPAVNNQLHLSGRITSRTERETDSVLIHLTECSPLIGPQQKHSYIRSNAKVGLVAAGCQWPATRILKIKSEIMAEVT